MTKFIEGLASIRKKYKQLKLKFKNDYFHVHAILIAEQQEIEDFLKSHRKEKEAA